MSGSVEGLNKYYEGDRMTRKEYLKHYERQLKASEDYRRSREKLDRPPLTKNQIKNRRKKGIPGY